MKREVLLEIVRDESGTLSMDIPGTDVSVSMPDSFWKDLIEGFGQPSGKDTSTITWINLDGIHDIGVIEKIGKHFGIHPLTLEDIIDTDQRPKEGDLLDREPEEEL